MTETFPENHAIEIVGERRVKVAALLLAREVTVPPALLLGSSSPSHEAGVYGLWVEIEVEALSRWIEHHPGTRPPAWWWWRAPEPLRRRTGGTGETTGTGVISYSAYKAPGVSMRNSAMAALGPLPDYQRCWCGLPLNWIGVDPADQPSFESQAQFLKRHVLLAPGEARRLMADDFRPERVEIAAE